MGWVAILGPANPTFFSSLTCLGGQGKRDTKVQVLSKP